MRNWINLIEHAAPSVVSELVFRDIDWSGGSGEQVIANYLHDSGDDDDDLYDSDYDIGDISKKVDINSPSFKSWFARWVENQYGDAEWTIQNKIHDGRITLWRCVTAPRDWKLDPERHPGIYWSWDEHAAEAHWGKFDKDHIEWGIEGSVAEHEIDWITTLAKNAHPSFQEEKEVRIKSGADVKIIKVYQKWDR